MKTKIFTLSVLLSLLTLSCSKKDLTATPDQGPLGVTPNNEFTWSTSKHIVLNLTVERPANCTEKAVVFLVDENNVRIDAALANGKQVQFDLVVPAVMENAKIVLPQTGQSTPVSLSQYVQDLKVSMNCPPSGKADDDRDGVWNTLDDFPADGGKIFRTTYPYAGYAINGYEDLWPSMGDYDFNDLVLKYQVSYAHNPDNKKVRADFRLVISAIGAGLHNGLGLQWLESGTGNQKYRLPDTQLISALTGDAASIEDKNVVRVFDDVFTAISSYYTNVGVGPSRTPDTLLFSMNMSAQGQPSFLIPDFFLFRTDDRGLEIHLPDRPPTRFADQSVFRTFADFSNPAESSWYKTKNNLSWGIEVITGGDEFSHPLSKTSIIEAYPGFLNWVKTSGSEDRTWYLEPVVSKIYSM